jgi:hypothetical protein
MGLNDFSPIITNDLGQGLGVYGVCTPFNSALRNNGANQPLGSLCYIPPTSQSGDNLLTTAGVASGLWVKYVLYKSTANPSVKTGPAIVYYTDETFTTVSGVFTEGLPSSTGGSAATAGWLLPNAGTVAGIGAGSTAFTNTVLNNGGNGCYVYIGVSGFIPSAALTAGSQGNMVYGSTGNWTVTAVAEGGTAPAQKLAAWVWGAVTSNIGDIQAILPLM